MTTIRTHTCDGTAGSDVGTEAGFDSIHGTLTYNADGYDGQCIEATTSPNYGEDDLTDQYVGLYANVPSAPGENGVSFAYAYNAAGQSQGALVYNPDGTIGLYSTLSTNVATSTTAIPTGTWARYEYHVGAGTQTLKIFTDPASTVPTETINGSTRDSDGPSAWAFGNPWTARPGDVLLDQIEICDAWPDMGSTAPSAPTVRGVIQNGVEVSASLRGVIQNGAETTASIQTVISASPPPQDRSTIPFTLPFIIGG